MANPIIYRVQSSYHVWGTIGIQIDSTIRCEGSAVKNSPVFFFFSQSFDAVSKSEMTATFFQRD